MGLRQANQLKPPFVIRRKTDGHYAKGRYSRSWDALLGNARVFGRKVDAANARPWHDEDEDPCELVSVRVIDAKEYDDLKDSERLLVCLQSGGVDNWEGYYESTRDYYRGMDE